MLVETDSSVGCVLLGRMKSSLGLCSLWNISSRFGKSARQILSSTNIGSYCSIIQAMPAQFELFSFNKTSRIQSTNLARRPIMNMSSSKLSNVISWRRIPLPFGHRNVHHIWLGCKHEWLVGVRHNNWRAVLLAVRHARVAWQVLVHGHILKVILVPIIPTENTTQKALCESRKCTDRRTGYCCTCSKKNCTGVSTGYVVPKEPSHLE